jgi:hypothetical protein
MAFDVITPAKLGQAAITTGVTTLYTVPASTRTLAQRVQHCQHHGSDHQCARVLGAIRRLGRHWQCIPIRCASTSNNTLQYNGIEVLNAGDTIQIQAASAGLTIIASGGEAT